MKTDGYGVSVKTVPKKSKKQQRLSPLTAREHFWLSAPPHLSMQFLCKGTGDGTDWFNVTFRIYQAYLTAEREYIPEDAELFKRAYAALEKILVKDVELQKIWLFANQEDVDLVSDCLRYSDDMQHEISRETQIFMYKKAKVKMLNLIK